MKYFLFWTKYLYPVILFLALNNTTNGQSKAAFRLIDSTALVVKTDSLRNLYAYKKTYPIEHELPILIALSYFPELDSTEIVFKEAKITTTLNARPTLHSLLFKDKSERKYIIRINKKHKDGQIYLDEVPFNAKIGLFGHEFSHFIDYKEKNTLRIIQRLVSYTFIKTRARYEKEIDKMTLQRGLGRQLYNWSEYVLYESDADRYYKRMKRLVYLTPPEILFLIEEEQNED
jgi:hypothetical protein